MEQPSEKKLRVTKSNDLVQASYRLSTQEQRLLLAAIAQIDPRKPMSSTVSVHAHDFTDIYGVDPRNSYAVLKDAADGLWQREIQTFDGKHRSRIRWVYKAIYVEGEGRVTLHFTSDVMPYLSMLNSKILTYDLLRVARLESSYSFRLFEMMMQFRSTGILIIDLEDFRTALALDDKYTRFNSLRERVINPSIAELRDKAGLEVELETKKAGRTVKTLVFRFRDKAQMSLGLTEPPLPDEEIEMRVGLTSAGA